MFGRRRSLLARAALVATLACCCSAGVAHAEKAAPSGSAEGYVLAIEGDDVIVDLGIPRGAVEGDVIELWRPIEIVHPITKQRIRDRYRVGTLKIVQVREHFAIAVVQGEAKKAPEPGDFVILRRVVAVPAQPATPVRPTPSASATPNGSPSTNASVDAAETAKVAALLESVKNATLVERIRAYVAYVKENPNSPYARVIREDAVQYHRLLRAGPEHGAAPAPAPASFAQVTAISQPPPVDFDPPSRALEGKSLDFGLYAAPPSLGAVLHVRHPGEVAYRSMTMIAAGDGYYRVTVPASEMRPPSVEYFVEIVDSSGQSKAANGSDDTPLTIEVRRDASAPPPTLQTLTTVAASVDFADYNIRHNNDQTFQTEGLLGMRFADVGVRALRTGFGVYRGVGGSLEELDELQLKPRSVGLTYGYLEGEFAFIPTAALALRGVCGLTEDGVTGGVLGLVRIGSDLETNLTLGGEFLGGVGVRGITQLELRSVPRVPIVLRSEVTNQPAGTTGKDDPSQSRKVGELGLRSIVQVGYEFLPGFVVAVRGSYQGRTINHAGPGGGGAVSYTW